MQPFYGKISAEDRWRGLAVRITHTKWKTPYEEEQRYLYRMCDIQK
jgi:hypothetical protein